MKNGADNSKTLRTGKNHRGDQKKQNLLEMLRPFDDADREFVVESICSLHYLLKQA